MKAPDSPFPLAADSIAAVDVLYRSHHDWLQGWLRRKTGCTFQAADLAQDTFVRVMQRRESAVIHEPRAYLTTVANGLLVDHWRRKDIESAWLAAVAAQPAAVAPSAEHRALVLEALCLVDRMLAALPDRVHRAFLMSQLHGMTYAAIALELDVSERMVKKYMAQAMLACLDADIGP